MRITPLDVRKQEFRKSVRGFDCDEVRAFLTTLADEYETVLVDNKVVRERLTDQDEKIDQYQGMERTLRDTMMTAERVMQETKDNATREGELVIQEARLKAKGILEECRVRTEELRREIIGLRKEKETYLARFKGLAESQINFIETHKDDFSDLDQRLIDMVDSVVGSKTQAYTAEPTVNTDSDQWRDYKTTNTKGAGATAASVDMAAMGIPVAAVELPEEAETTETSSSDESDTVTT